MAKTAMIRMIQQTVLTKAMTHQRIPIPMIPAEITAVTTVEIIAAMIETMIAAEIEMIVEIVTSAEIAIVIAVDATEDVIVTVEEIVADANVKSFSLKTMYFFQSADYSTFSIITPSCALVDIYRVLMMFMYLFSRYVATDYVKAMSLLVRFANHAKENVAKSSAHSCASIQSTAWSQNLRVIALISPN
jgi:hypothetical protein